MTANSNGNPDNTKKTYAVNKARTTGLAAGTTYLFNAIKVVKGSNTGVLNPLVQRGIRAVFGANGRNTLVNGNLEGKEMSVDVVDLKGNRIADLNSTK